jgi:hypothetical protein
VLTGTYQNFLTAIAAAGGALTGLLFVALSVAPRSRAVSYPAVIREVRAAAALLAFTSALSVSLFGLVPGTNAGYPALITGIIGLLFTAAGFRSIVMSPDTTIVHVRRQASLIILLLVAFGFDLGSGVGLLVAPQSTGGAESLCYVLVGLLLIGIARSWELVGDRDTGILASLSVLVGRDPSAEGTGQEGADRASCDPAPAEGES